MDNPLKFGLRIIQDGIGLWLHNNAFLRAGALAFYKLFSLAPYVPPRRSSRRCTSSRARSAGSGSILADTNSERERRGAATGARITAAWLLVLFGWSAAASAAVPTATLPAFVNDGSSTPVQIDDSSSMQAIAEGFLIHKEPPGRQMAPADLERILSLPRGAWESGAEPANRASSFVPVTMWMLAVVENPTEVPLERWLMLRSWRLWDARLFAIDVDSGEVLASYETGQRVPMAKRVVQRPEATFPLLLEPRERVLLVLRIEDKSFAVVGAYLVDPGHQIQRAQRLHDVSVALLGFLTAIALILLAQGQWRYAAIAAWLMATAVFEFSFQVPLLQTLLPSLTQYSITVFTVSGSLGLAAFALMTLSFLGLRRNRFWCFVYGLCVAVLVACSLAIPWVEEHQIVRKIAAMTALFLILSWPLAAWSGRSLLAKPYSRLLWALFAAFWVFYTIRVLMLNGLLNVDVESHPMVLVYLSGLVAFSLAVVGVDSRIRRDAAARLQHELDAREEAEQQRMLSRQREEAARLTAEVERQTEALRKANAQALASSEAKSKFLSSASHELRAPLHDLLGYAQLLAREIPPEAQSHLSVIQKSGKQLLHLIDDILEFSRGDAKPMVLDEAPVSLPALAAHLEATCAPAAARGGNRFETRVHLGAVEWVIADERRLTQVLRNLIDNACKFTRDGVIELRIETVDAVATAADPDDADEPLVRFSVRDTGVGIPDDQQEAIFEAFKRLDRYDRAPGLGLGLAICRQIVTACGGRITVQSRQGRHAGSVFSFDLRLRSAATRAEVAGGGSPRAILGYRGQPRTVLIVDDRASSRRLLADRCEFLGLEVLEAADGRDALDLLGTRETTPDLALVDQFMPELDGWGFLRRVRAAEEYRKLPVVLVSAAPLERPDGFSAGVEFDEVALKPLSATALTDILQRHLGLEWEYAETHHPPDDARSTRRANPTELLLPPGCCDLKLAQLKEMLALGAVVAIEQWAVEMAETYPSHSVLWSEIRQRAKRVDLDGLRELVAELRPTTSGAERSEEVS